VPTLDVIDLYDKLRLAPDETERARLIAHAFAELEQRYPQLDEIVTTRALSETELRLIKEIEQVRAELKETELKLSKEIEQVRAELKETELKLSKEIEQVRAELKVEIARSHASLLKWSFLFWASQLGAILLLAWRLFGHS
jgi:DNA anti-recombination protein RmuC